MIIDLSKPIPGAPNIGWHELVRTSHRVWMGRNATVPVAFEPAGVALAQMLQIIRDQFASPLIVHSGYRCLELNRAIGGALHSQHMRFEAADFHVTGFSLRDVFDWIRGSGIAFGQLILEGYDPPKGQSSWVHLSLGYPWRAQETSGQVLTYSAKSKRYARV